MEDPWVRDGADYQPERRSKLKILLRVSLALLMVGGASWFFHTHMYGWLYPDSSPPQAITAVAISPDRPDFVSDDLGFAVKFPGEPEVRTANVASGNEPEQMTTFKSGADEAGYLVSVLDLRCAPAVGDVDPWLNESAEAAVKSAFPGPGPTPAQWSQTFTKVQNHRAVEAEATRNVDGRKQEIKVAVLFAGSKYFALFATNPPDGSWDTFLQSFKVTADDGALPECAPLATT